MLVSEYKYNYMIAFTGKMFSFLRISVVIGKVKHKVFAYGQVCANHMLR